MPAGFVIHLHSGFGPTHYDLMIECDGALATWQFQDSPCAIGQGGAISCVKIADHRLAYLDYQGPVSGNRGEVTAVDSGQAEILDRTDARWLVRLAGEKKALRGTFELRRQSDREWVLRCIGPGGA
jgi:hypothetical protein